MTSHVLPRSIVIAVRCSIAAAIGCDSFELPDPPDISGLVVAYEHPSGQLDRATVRDIAASLVDRADLTRDRVPLDLTAELVRDVEDVGEDQTDFGEEAGVQMIQGTRVDVAATMRLHHTCGGWDAQPTTDEAKNGSVEITMTIDRDGVIPTMWGHFDRCKHRRGEMSVEIDGDLVVHFGVDQRRLRLGELSRTAYLVWFDGRLVAVRGDAVIDVQSSFSFRALPGGDIQLSVDLSDGTNVVGVFNPDVLRPAYREPSLRAGVLTRDRRWDCELSRDRGQCADQANAAEVVQW